MKKKWKSQAKTGVLLAVMLALYASCTVSFYKLKTNGDTSTILCGTSGGLDEAGYRAFREKEEKEEHPIDFCMWTEQEGVLLRNDQISRNAEVTVMKVRGSLFVIFPYPPSLQEDESGCYLDQTAAMELFGDQDIVGCEVDYGSRKLTVRGVTEDYGGLFLIYADPVEELDRITVKLKKSESSRNQIREFKVRHGLEGSVLSHNLLKETAQIFPVFLPAGIMILCLYEGRKRSRNARDIREKGVGYGLLAGAVILGVAAFLCFVDIPRDMIPTKWSDFDFFITWKENLETDVMSYIRCPKGLAEVPYVILFIKTFLTGLGSVILLGMARRSYMITKNMQ